MHRGLSTLRAANTFRPAGAHRAPHAVRRLARTPIVLAAMLALVVVAALTPAGTATATTARIYLGSTGDSAALSSRIGAQLSDHAYSQLSGTVPQGRMITVDSGDTWRSVAAARSGSAIYNNIVRWAQTIKSRGQTVLLAYSHEPEEAGASHGTAADFINAFRNFVSVFRAQGVTNVAYTWQMTAWAFRTSSSDPRYAAKWYPGDAYVDSVGADAYNWYTCGHGRGRNVPFSTLAGPPLAFARAHHKKASFPEFAMHASAARAAWIADTHTYLVANRDVVQGAFYFQQMPTNLANSDCRWPLNTSAEYKAYGDIARSVTYFMP